MSASFGDCHDLESLGGSHGISVLEYRRIFHDVTLPRQPKNWSIMAVQGAIADDHAYYKRERNIVLEIE